MATFLLRRLLWMIGTIWVVFTITFFLMRSVPGGPFDREKKIPDQIKRNIEAYYKLDRPLSEQYFYALRRLLFGDPSSRSQGARYWPDFGPSYRIEDFSVNEILAQGFPVSASLGIFALVFALALGTTAGVVSAIRRYSAEDVVLRFMATAGIAVPNFVLASLAILTFVFTIPLFPAAGWGTLKQILLPAVCLSLPFAGYISRLTRTGMMEVLSLDYIRTAHAKGLPERRVVLRHALRGALLPVVSFLGPAAVGVLTGSLVLEKIFNLPGMGSHFVEAATQRDYPLAMGAVLVYTFLLFVMNTLVDASYGLIDPRVKMSQQ